MEKPKFQSRTVGLQCFVRYGFILVRLEDFAVLYHRCERRDGLMVSALVCRSNGPGSSLGRGHCDVFLGKTLYSHSASLHPGVLMGTGECWG